jgi:hypothetical protein
MAALSFKGGLGKSTECKNLGLMARELGFRAISVNSKGGRGLISYGARKAVVQHGLDSFGRRG